jgi:glycosyltransferase involved in cell wall biosynthesis
MRLVYANNHLTLRGGCERVMFQECGHFRSLGHEVNVFGQYQPGALVDVAAKEHLPSAVEFEQLSIRARLLAATRIAYNVKTGRRFRRFLEATKPHLVHGHNIYVGLTTSIIDACQGIGIPFILTLHDFKLACPSYLMLSKGSVCDRCAGRKFYHCTSRKCHKDSVFVSFLSTVEAYFNYWFRKYHQARIFVCPSRFLAERMVAAGLPPGKLRQIPNGVDVSAVQPVYSGQTYFLYMGRLSREKGLHTLLNSVIGGSMPLRILGSGPDEVPLREFVTERGLSQVSLEGYKSGSGLAKLIAGAAFVVVPSEWYENASMTVLEAMSYGKPVIAARIGGLPEQVIHEETGLLFEPGNALELREQILRLAADTALRERMGRAARRRAEVEFSLERHCRRLLDVYAEVARESAFAAA